MPEQEEVPVASNGARSAPHHHHHPHVSWSPGRVALLACSAICLYLFAPSIAEVFSAYDRLGDVHPLWLLPAVLCAIASFACVWIVQAIALGTRDWFSVITTQLAGNSFNRITPGGGATGTALQANMLSDAGFDVAHAATALAVQSVLSTAAIVALPVFSLPFVIAGTQIPDGLLQAVWIGIPVFVLMVIIGIAIFVADRPLLALGHAVAFVRCKLQRGATMDRELGERLLESRDRIREAIGPRWELALGASLLRWLLEYGVLVLTLRGLGANPNPALVLLAFVAASVLGLLPFTPGGLGFVEAGMAATLSVAGISTGDALVATLVYRLLTFWLPIPLGAVAAYIFRRRHPHPQESAAPDDGESQLPVMPEAGRRPTPDLSEPPG
ncbi:MAG: putative heme transporter [Actinomycetota bacterium]|nr:putative heme transporter [Actinomycetota bacterium]